MVTSWSDARISWPRCQPMGQRGGHGLLFDGDLIRAVRTESALALAYWWGVSSNVVWRWRKLLGIPRAGTEGSKLLIQAAAEKGAEAMQDREFTPAERKAKSRNARRLKLGQYLQPGYHGPLWTAEELALLGTLPDADVAVIVGKSANAVRVQRTKKGIPAVKPVRADPDAPPERPAAPRRPPSKKAMEAAWEANRGRKHTEEARKKMSEAQRKRWIMPGTKAWTAAEDKLVRELPANEAATKTGRTVRAVYTRRSLLGLNDGRTARWV